MDKVIDFLLITKIDYSFFIRACSFQHRFQEGTIMKVQLTWKEEEKKEHSSF